MGFVLAANWESTLSDTAIFYSGALSTRGCQIQKHSGDRSAISMIFASPELPIDHPIASDRCIDNEAKAKRRMWIEDAINGTSSSLVQSYWLATNHDEENRDGEPSKSTRVLVTECLSLDRSNRSDHSNTTILGSMIVSETDGNREGAIADARSCLHKFNNELSVAAMSLDVATMQLERMQRPGDLDEIGEQIDSARSVIRNCGKLANEMLAKLPKR